MNGKDDSEVKGGFGLLKMNPMKRKDEKDCAKFVDSLNCDQKVMRSCYEWGVEIMLKVKKYLELAPLRQST